MAYEQPDDFTSVDGTITQPGKFEGEPSWAPYFWNFALNNESNENASGEHLCPVYRVDLLAFPVLDGVLYVALREAENGHISTRIVAKEEATAWDQN